MKKKRLHVVVALIFIFLTGSFFLDKNEQVKKSSSEVKVVGVLQFVSHPALDQIYKGIQEGLKEEGFREGENLKIIFQNGQADQSKLETMSQKLIQDQSDILVGIATPAAQALANNTTEIPIILGAITDPVSAGLVESDEKPGGNITGVSDKSPVESQFELFQTLQPKAKTVGVLYSSAEENSKFQVEEATKIADEKGLKVKGYPVPSGNEIAQTVQVMSGEVDFIYIPTDNTIANAMQTVVNEANKTKTPVFPSVDTMVEEGGLATVGINQFDLGVQTGKMTAKILNGSSEPATMPIYTFKTGDIIINQKQADFLGISIPSDIKKDAKIIE